MSALCEHGYGKGFCGTCLGLSAVLPENANLGADRARPPVALENVRQSSRDLESICRRAFEDAVSDETPEEIAIRTLVKHTKRLLEENRSARDNLCVYMERANRLSDENGAIRTERDDLLRENAVLRRKLEAVERKAAKR